MGATLVYQRLRIRHIPGVMRSVDLLRQGPVDPAAFALLAWRSTTKARFVSLLPADRSLRDSQAGQIEGLLTL